MISTVWVPQSLQLQSITAGWMTVLPDSGRVRVSSPVARVAPTLATLVVRSIRSPTAARASSPSDTVAPARSPTRTVAGPLTCVAAPSYSTTMEAPLSSLRAAPSFRM